MLKKKQRLTKEAFDIVFKKGQRVHSPTIQLIYQKSDVFHGSAVVGKKVCKKAVDRNRLRRRLYAVLYSYCKAGSCKGTYVLVAKPKLTEVSKKEFTQEVEKVLQGV